VMPDDYPLVRAAKYLGVAPWLLAEQSVLWQQRALLFEAAEIEAQKALEQQAQQQ
jgi:hypothetical protein